MIFNHREVTQGVHIVLEFEEGIFNAVALELKLLIVFKNELLIWVEE
jgi:hypothetical protein